MNDRVAREDCDAGLYQVTGFALLLIGEVLILANQIGGDVPYILSAVASIVLVTSGLLAIGLRIREGVADER